MSQHRVPSVVRRRASPTLLAALPLLAFAVAPLTAQTWVAATSGYKEGDPALIDYLPGESSPTRSTVSVVIPGFWIEDVLGDDGVTYQRLTFPGIPCIDEVGAPELPAARWALAVASDGDTLELNSIEVLDSQILPDIHVYPTPEPGEDEDPSEDPGPGDTVGYDEKFALDSAIYASSGQWPATVAPSSFAVGPMLGPVKGAAVSIHPVSWDPAADRLIVKSRMKVTFTHDAPIATQAVLTKPKNAIAAKTFVNWNGGATLGYLADLISYDARYLVVADPAHFDTLLPFKHHKQVRGFQVTLAALPSGFTQLRETIADWYALGEPGMDHFCLLVGDVDEVPQPSVIKQLKVVWTDDLYGSVGNDDLLKEVHVGRLSIDSEADLSRQLAKIIAYEASPQPGGDYDEVLLVAHEQGAPGKYQGAQEQVRLAGYAQPPTFLTRYGAQGATDLGVRSDIDDGVGVVCYRGHGSTNAFTGWNNADQDFNKNDVLDLDNKVHPVVWSFACTNSNIAFDTASSQDCLAETWLEADGIGAVASYAATRGTSTSVNHEHDKLLFKTVYNFGITTHGQALDVTEMLMWLLHGDHRNFWAYMLLGDPSMTLRTKEPSLVVTSLPDSIDAGVLGQVLDVTVSDDAGLPLADAILSGHKASFLTGGDDEFLEALWTDAEGQVQVDLSQLTPGLIEFSARLGDGSVKTHEVTVGMGPAWTDLGHGLAGDGSVVPQLVGVGSLAGGTPMSLLMRNARPNATAWFILSLVEEPLPFKGGLLIPCVQPPSIVLPLPTDGHGDLGFTLEWPDGLPSGAEVFVQYWIQDPAGPFGFAASNGLRGVTP